MPPTLPKSSLSRILIFAVGAITVLLVLRFVFAIALSLLKWLALAALVAMVVWLVMSKGEGPRYRPPS